VFRWLVKVLATCHSVWTRKSYDSAYLGWICLFVVGGNGLVRCCWLPNFALNGCSGLSLAGMFVLGAMMICPTTGDSSGYWILENEGPRKARRAAVVVHIDLGTAIGSHLASCYTSHPEVTLRKGNTHTVSPYSINKGLVGHNRDPWIMPRFA
jgi:hypothetical protein